jgi:protein-disulfide isomerase
MDNKLTKDERKALRKEEWQEELKKDQQKKMVSKIAWISGSVIIILAAFWAIINFTGSTQQDQTLITHMPAITDKDLQTGPKNAKVTLTEYADFQCPACGNYYPLVEHLRKDFNGKIHFVYRTFPLVNVHQNALAAAEAAYAASLQGKFWDLYNLLYQNQTTWGESKNPQPNFDEYAQKVGLNMDQFHKDSKDPKTQKFIMDEENAGTKSGVNSTPTFFINGKQIQNPQSYDQFKQDIQDALK